LIGDVDVSTHRYFLPYELKGIWKVATFDYQNLDGNVMPLTHTCQIPADAGISINSWTYDPQKKQLLTTVHYNGNQNETLIYIDPSTCALTKLRDVPYVPWNIWTPVDPKRRIWAMSRSALLALNVDSLDVTSYPIPSGNPTLPGDWQNMAYYQPTNVIYFHGVSEDYEMKLWEIDINVNPPKYTVMTNGTTVEGFRADTAHDRLIFQQNDYMCYFDVNNGVARYFLVTLNNECGLFWPQWGCLSAGQAWDPTLTWY